MEETYAQALWQMIEAGMQPKKAVHALVESVQAHGRDALLPRIARAFGRIAERQMRKNALIISVAHEKDANKAKRQAKEMLEEAGVDPKDIEVRIDDTLIGGWHLEGRGTLIDNSFKKSLLDMYNAATSSI